MTRSMRPAKSALGLVIERLVLEQGFRARLMADPRTTLAGYRLGELEVALLAELLTEQAPPAADATMLAAKLDQYVAGGALAALNITARRASSEQRAS